jgi:hypothetical protein
MQTVAFQGERKRLQAYLARPVEPNGREPVNSLTTFSLAKIESAKIERRLPSVV